MTERRHLGRLIAVAVVVMLAFCGLGARLAYLQLSPDDEQRARINKSRRLEQDLTIGRGKILDRNGNVLALDLAQKVICADPSLIHSNGQIAVVASFIGKVVGMDPNVLAARLGRIDRRFIYLCGYGHHINEEQAQEIESMRFPGIYLNDVMVRSYPRGLSMCHVVGCVNLERIGCAGIEQRWDKYLRDIPGVLISEKDGSGQEVYGKRVLEIKPRSGADVFLTLDQYVQYITEQALQNAVKTNMASAGWAIVQRVRTGEILAMASYPNYDPNEFRTAQAEHKRNRCISTIVEPGSTFKVAVISAALNEGLVTPSQIFDCENGIWFYKGRSLRDFHSYGKLSVADIIKKSSNIGAAKIALLLGPAKLHSYLKAFGLSRRMGIELPGEEAGILHPVSRWSSLSITRIAIGHEVALTALQMLGVVCAIANDGVLMKPYLVRQVLSADGSVLFRQEPTVLARPIRADTAAVMKRLMARVTEEGGTGHRARVRGYTVGGKTGTAQKPVKGGYSDHLNIASFVGFIPVEDPQLAIIVVLDEPKQLRRTGGVVAAPAFREIAEQTVRYLDVPVSGNTVLARGPIRSFK